jgi:hypothetical protein
MFRLAESKTFETVPTSTRIFICRFEEGDLIGDLIPKQIGWARFWA